MSGRDFFERFSIFINVLSSFFLVFPGFIITLLWDIVSPFSGRVSILVRYCVMAKRFKCIGSNVYFGRFVILRNTRGASFGSNISIHDSCYIDAIGGLEIGNDVSIAHHTSILTFNHTWSNHRLAIKYNPIECAPVKINDDVWIGCGVRIMPGVEIGARSIIAAGSVVTRSVPPGVIVAGVPAKVVKSIV
ncbi:acyltransferase [Pseudomonas sp. ESBL1]|uniref:acyltransferase n=1 Tax=Pseudomonas sp. ESBL1 TaxID=3077324 RepID=UPI003FA79D01